MLSAITPHTTTEPRRRSLSATRYARAYDDLFEGLRRAWFWSALALQDIRLRYRGSILGPLWLTLSTGVMVAALGILYSRLFHTEIAVYLPYVGAGLVLWQFVAGIINEGCTTFTAVQPLIQQVKIPYSTHAYRVVFRNLIILAHNLVIIIVVQFLFHVPLGWRSLLFVPALCVVVINGVWISLLFGMITARFRDVPPIVASFVQVLFFVTPIFWAPDALGIYQTYGELNPLFAAIDIMRSPLLALDAAPYSWKIVGCVSVIGWLVTLAFFARFRSRIAFWV
jgi:ABC-type polysaccharide/polyol phosphate export permease